MPTALVPVPRSTEESIARELVERRLAASVNRVDCTSTYRWEGDVQCADETLLLIKTTAEKYDDVVELVEERHPYEVVPVERLDESDAPAPFLEWRDANVSSD